MTLLATCAQLLPIEWNSFTKQPPSPKQRLKFDAMETIFVHFKFFHQTILSFLVKILGKKPWECQKSNLGLLGSKRERCPLVS